MLEMLEMDSSIVSNVASVGNPFCIGYYEFDKMNGKHALTM